MTGIKQTEAAKTTFLAAAIITGINLASMILDGRDHAFVALMVTDAVHAVIAATVAVAMRRVRPWTPRACDLAFVIATAPFLVGMWLPQTHDLESGKSLEPMLAHHFLLLGIAVVAPSWRSGSAMIVVFTAHAIVLAQVLSGGATSPSLDREPWFTLVFCVFAVMLLYTRERRRKLAQRLAAAEARAQMHAQVSRVLLALRDRANTPLQTLEVAISMLEQGDDSRATLSMLRRALDRLVAVQRAISVTQTPSDLVPQELEVLLQELTDSESSLRS